MKLFLATIFVLVSSVCCHPSVTSTLNSRTQDDELIRETRGVQGHKKWRYLKATGYNPLEILITSVNISERKYPEKKAVFIEIREKLAKHQSVLNQEKRKLSRNYLAKLKKVKYKQVGLSEKGVRIYEAIGHPGKFRKTKEFLEFQKSASRRQKVWVDNILSKYHSVAEILETEAARYLFVKLGTQLFFTDEFAGKIDIDKAAGEKYTAGRAKLIDDFKKSKLQLYNKSVDKVFKLLSRKQIRKLERRLGIPRKEFANFLAYRKRQRFVWDLAGKRKYAIKINRETKMISGLKGLIELSEELPKDLQVRYHATERTPKKTSKASSEFKNYLSLVGDNTPLNTLKISPLETMLESNNRLEAWEQEPTEKQFKDFAKAVYGWKLRANKAKSIVDRIEANNEFLEKLDEIMLGKQGLAFFRGFFLTHGPVVFFFLPGVKEDFELRESQLEEIRAIGKELAENANSNELRFVEMEVDLLRKTIGDRSMLKAMNLMKMSVKEATSQRLEYLMKRGAPTDKNFSAAGIRVLFRTHINEPGFGFRY